MGSLLIDLSGDGAGEADERVTLDDLKARGGARGLVRLLLEKRRDQVFLRLKARTSASKDRLLAGTGLLARADFVSVEYATEEVREPLTRKEALLALLRVAREAWETPFLVRRASTRARRLTRQNLQETKETRPFLKGSGKGALVLRTDMDEWVSAGGSIAHLQGILKELAKAGHAPVLVTPAKPRGLELPFIWEQVPRSLRFTGSREAKLLAYDETLLPALRVRLSRERPALLYERYGAGSLAGAIAAREAGLPHVLEYNGSETWVARRWGEGPLRYERVFERIERAALLAADVVSVVSRPLEEEAIARGVPGERVVLAPNGVEPERFPLPELEARRDELRAQLGFRKEDVVLGFVSSFGPWHGAEVLARAFSLLDDAARDPEKARALTNDERAREVLPRLRLLLVGEGARLEAVRRELEPALSRKVAVATGLVPQSEAPRYLVAADVLASPHVPNEDGTKFFGSPTKVFEYMASARAIVASDLDQVGEVLRPALSLGELEQGASAGEARAVLVRPGDPRELARALASLAARPGLARALGARAREAALRDFTWETNLRRVLERLTAISHRERHAPLFGRDTG